jgi:hypothetical protein
MKTLNTLLAASTLALGACQESTPICNRACTAIVTEVAAQANATLSDADKSARKPVLLSSIDASCKAKVSNYVINCMVQHGSEGLGLPGDDCLNMAIEKLRRCARQED